MIEANLLTTIIGSVVFFILIPLFCEDIKYSMVMYKHFKITCLILVIIFAVVFIYTYESFYQLLFLLFVPSLYKMTQKFNIWENADRVLFALISASFIMVNLAIPFIILILSIMIGGFFKTLQDTGRIKFKRELPMIPVISILTLIVGWIF